MDSLSFQPILAECGFLTGPQHIFDVGVPRFVRCLSPLRPRPGSTRFPFRHTDADDERLWVSTPFNQPVATAANADKKMTGMGILRQRHVQNNSRSARRAWQKSRKTEPIDQRSRQEGSHRLSGNAAIATKQKPGRRAVTIHNRFPPKCNTRHAKANMDNTLVVWRPV